RTAGTPEAPQRMAYRAHRATGVAYMEFALIAPSPLPSLSASHSEMLIAQSGIDPAVIARRGYRTIADPADLIDFGFADYQRRTGLLIPIHDVHGEIALHQLRPDNPRIQAGKERKYEMPARARVVLDVPPVVLSRLGDPGVPLW